MSYDVSRGERFKRFVAEAKKRRIKIPWSTELVVVKYQDVKELLYNMAMGHEPDYRVPPAWIGKDCVGMLKKRGWAVADDHKGMYRRSYVIDGESIENVNQLLSDADCITPEYQADALEANAKKKGTKGPDEKKEVPVPRVTEEVYSTSGLAPQPGSVLDALDDALKDRL